MTHWSDKYIGSPYVPEDGDCAVLASRVAREVLAMDVRLPTGATRYSEQARQIDACKDDYAIRVNAPIDGHPAIFRPRHIGIMCDIGGIWYVLHADQAAGFVVRQRLVDMTRLRYRLEGFYKWL